MSKRVRDQPSPAVMRGSGNVFADLGFADAEARLAKAELSRAIRLIIQRRGITQRAAANLLGLATSDMSDLIRGKLARFSQERLVRCLLALEMNVTIQVAPKSARARQGRLIVALDAALAATG